MVFFHNSIGGEFVAAAWNPSAFSPQPFKAAHAHGMKPLLVLLF